MPRASITALLSDWRNRLFTAESWTISSVAQIASGEAGGFRVENTIAPFGAYLKPKFIKADGTPRAGNEKIVADLASELEMSVPPVVLYDRGTVVAGDENKCCLSLVMYPEVYEWGIIFNISSFPPLVQGIIKSTMSLYSQTVALDLLIGQTDRDNARNVVFGTDSADPSDASFMFVDHSFTLNRGNRWDSNGWTNIEPVPLPAVFRSSLSKNRLLEGADKIAGLTSATIESVVMRIPTDYMPEKDKQIICEGLIGRKQLVRKYIEQTF